MRVFAGWDATGGKLTREITLHATQVRRPTPRRPHDASSSRTVRQDHAAPVQEEMCDEEVRDIRKIVRDATQGTRDREEGGVKEGWWTEGVGRARAALGRFMSAAPRTLGFPFSTRHFDPSGGLRIRQTKPTPVRPVTVIFCDHGSPP